MTKFSIIGAAFALSLSTAAFATADCCKDMTCCKEGADCCDEQKSRQSCCDDMKHGAHAGHDMSGSPKK